MAFFCGNQDGLMRHPRDSQAWKAFDLLYPEFAVDLRNVRLGLASDGFNPFGAMATNYSIWPVVLIPYNRPPWECMKQTSFILSMIIPGKQMPDNDIDVYLQPLIQELRELWYNGVQTLDSSKNEIFKMRATLMWTISDFPGLEPYLDGTHTLSLLVPHRVRFNGKIEQREPPIALSGSDILKQMEVINASFGKVPESNAKDLMHIEKNVCGSVIYTLLNDTEKSKDNLKARNDLREMGIRKELWADENGSYRPALFTLLNSKKSGFKKDIFLRTLKNVKMADGYASNITRCVDLKQQKLKSMKSHDFHILMQHLLPISIRNVLPDKVTAVLTELSLFFHQLCAKSLSPLDLDRLQSRYFITMNHLEMLFPPTFFTIMVHLTCHLASETKLGGPQQCRWMYLIDRYLGHFKSYVRNMSQPEDSITEGYLAEEDLTF